MKCPHCGVAYHPQNNAPILLGEAALLPLDEMSQTMFWWTRYEICPACYRMIVWLIASSTCQYSDHGVDNAVLIPAGYETRTLVYPKGTNRPPVPTEVPQEFATDYLEACRTLADSPKASAALSRRCLQHILREKVRVKKSRLIDEIKEVRDSGQLPSTLVALINQVREIGNDAAHPNLNKGGMIVDVEPWEAEWCLEVIEALFYHYFVAPVEHTQRLERLAKLRQPNQ